VFLTESSLPFGCGSPAKTRYSSTFPTDTSYNQERIHASLDYRTPMAVYLGS